MDLYARSKAKPGTKKRIQAVAYRFMQFKKPDRAITLSLTLITILTVGILGLFITTTSRYIDEMMAGSSVNEARLIAARMEATFHWIDASTTLLADRYYPALWLPPGSRDSGAIDLAMLSMLTSMYPELVGFHFLDAYGTILLNTDPESGIHTLLDSGYFESQRADPQEGVRYSDSKYCEATDTLLLLVCHPIIDDGIFMGVVGASIDLGFYEKLFAGLSIGSKGMASIRRSDTSRLLVRWPRITSRMNNEASTIPPQQLVESGIESGVVKYKGKTDSVIRVFAFQKLIKFPFYVLVGRSVSEQFLETRIFWLFMALATFVILGIVWLLLYHLKARQQQLQKSEAEFRAVVDSQPDLVFRWLMDTTLTFANSNFATLFRGKFQEGIIGRKWLELLDPEEQELAGNFLARFSQDLQPAAIDFPVTFEDGSHKVFDCISVPLHDAGGRITEVQTVGRDVSERLQTQAKLKTALCEKEVLLREVYHRTRNNLQVISSIISIEGAKYRASDYSNSLLTIEQRIDCMGLIHQMLMGSDDITTIELLDFARVLAGSIVSAYSSEQEIELEIDGDAVKVMVDEATPIGLILNELLTNSCKHAFRNGQKGRIQLRLEHVDEGTLVLDYVDSGTGVISVQKIRESQGVGSLLIWSLAENQLGGNITVDSTRGLHYTIRVKIGGYSNRIS
jgi:PAS domain S-box-containing protein